MRLLAFACLALLSLPAFAGFKGTIEFTDAEKAAHLEKLDTMLETSAQCLQDDLDRHKEFVRKYGVSAFYGDNTAFAKKTGADGKFTPTTAEEKQQMLRDIGIKESLILQMVPSTPCAGGIDQCPLMMQPTSCISLALKCLSKGLKTTGQEETWGKLRKYVLANGSTGDSVLDGLQKLGWKIAYWNPDTDKNEKWDAKDQSDYPGNPQNIWGQHAAMWKQVQEKHMYYFNTVDDWSALVDFGIFPPKFLRKAAFFIGIAHIGYHVFPGTYGHVIEGHSAREVTDKHTMEESVFNPMSFFGGGGPRGGPYKSGLMALPPGALEE